MCTQVAANQCKTGALVLFIKDIEKAMVGNNDVLKSKFETLPQNIVVIGSNTQLDSRKEKVPFITALKCMHLVFVIMIIWKIVFVYLITVSLCFQTHPGGLLFTKFGSNQTALLDLAFPVL